MADDIEPLPPASGRPFQATAARIVLDDCRQLLHELQENPQGQRWRVRWAAVVVLLRAVGHVLDNVDADPKTAAPEFVEAAREWWAAVNASKPAPAIFWSFIRKHRNDIVKEYRFAAEQLISRGGYFGGAYFGSRYFGSGYFGPPAGPVYPITEGPFKGRDQRDLVAEAIAWWEEQLGEIALRAGAKALAKALPPDL